MKLEIHKSATATADAAIDISETFPDHYTDPQVAEICETEALALLDTLNAVLPTETKAALVRLVVSGKLF